MSVCVCVCACVHVYVCSPGCAYFVIVGVPVYMMYIVYSIQVLAYKRLLHVRGIQHPIIFYKILYFELSYKILYFRS